MSRKNEKITMDSANPRDDRLEQLKSIVPEAFAEGRVDFDKLRESLGDLIDDRPERYTFNWAGKRDTLRLLQTPTRATLVPDREESVNFDDTQNLFIEGDNLEVLKLLYKPYFGRVKMVYIDPPYNTGNDFIYRDNYTDPLESYLQLTGQKDAKGNLLTSNPETSGRFHSAWLSMMYPRLFLARQLLKEDGVIFVSIDDNESHDLHLLMNEVFGEENFITTIIWQKNFAPRNTAKHFSEDHDYIMVYARNAESWRPNLLPRSDEAKARYQNPDNDPRGDWSSSDLTARNYYSEGQYVVTSPSGKKFKPAIGTYWRVKYEKFLDFDRDNRIWWGENGDSMPRLKRFLSEVKGGVVPQTIWGHKKVGHTQEAKKELLACVKFEHTENVLNTVKPTRLLQHLLKIATNPETRDIVLDFFAGSAATAHAVLKQNREDGGTRRFIMVQFPESLPKPEPKLDTIADIGKERLRSVISKMKESDEGKFDLAPDEDLAFKVFKLAESSFRPWKGVKDDTSEAYAQQMNLFTDPLVDNWEAHDVIYEVALKEGYGLSCQIKPLTDVSDNTVYQVSEPDKEQSFYICLDKTLQAKTIRALNLTKDNLFICRDIALDDETAANLALQCRLKTI